MKVGDISGTYGAILLGALISAFLSGVFAVQCTIYFKFYPRDGKSMKGLVLFVWSDPNILFCETILRSRKQVFGVDPHWPHLGIYVELPSPELWKDPTCSVHPNHHCCEYNVSFSAGIPDGINVKLGVVLTAVLTFLTHCLFAQRMYHPSASASGAEMIRLQTYPTFRKHFRWLFSMGLGLSCALDIMITLSLFFLLRKTRRQSIMLHSIIDSLILYAFEIGTLTSAATVASMLCWVLIDNNLIFLALHFIVGKLYANSLLATLNSRHQLRRVHSTALDLMHFNLPHITDGYVSSP
ncbi:hypothetical protein CVT26_004783 [Gymnopilus dilepis]|uniref:DUF6534 domain-containing protein n=1 Tax=Gymnopilus dilepis TaxID=231916 RepID=A0A409XZE1_9AGAR|nr:hypothetical protein CVT26_004783 [Gymnopilus dilepis]